MRKLLKKIQFNKNYHKRSNEKNQGFLKGLIYIKFERKKIFRINSEFSDPYFEPNGSHSSVLT